MLLSFYLFLSRWVIFAAFSVFYNFNNFAVGPLLFPRIKNLKPNIHLSKFFDFFVGDHQLVWQICIEMLQFNSLKFLGINNLPILAFLFGHSYSFHGTVKDHAFKNRGKWHLIERQNNLIFSGLLSLCLSWFRPFETCHFPEGVFALWAAHRKNYMVQ